MMKFQGSVFTCAMLVSGAASASVDMPGGPKVNQLNLTTGITEIARDVAWLHWMMLIICLVIFDRCVWGHVLFDLGTPQVQRRQARHLP